jgi:hypothetical protein
MYVPSCLHIVDSSALCAHPLQRQAGSGNSHSVLLLCLGLCGEIGFYVLCPLSLQLLLIIQEGLGPGKMVPKQQIVFGGLKHVYDLISFFFS